MYIWPYSYCISSPDSFLSVPGETGELHYTAAPLKYRKARQKQVHAQEETLISFPKERNFARCTPVWPLSLKVNREQDPGERGRRKVSTCLPTPSLLTREGSHRERTSVRAARTVTRPQKRGRATCQRTQKQSDRTSRTKEMGLAVFPLLLEKGKKYYPVDEVVTRLEEAQPEPSTVARTRQKRGTRRCLLERAGPLALSVCVTVRANETLNVRCWKQVLKTPSLPLLLN